MVTNQSMAAIQNALIATGKNGNQPLISQEMIAKIVEHLSVGNYVKPSVEACGIHYTTFRSWVVRGEQEKAEGKDTLYTYLIDALAHAQAQAEASIVHELRKAEDWRAQAFVLERRHRDRWGKDEQQNKAAVTINLPAEVAGVLLDALSVGSKHLPVIESTPAIDASFEQLAKPSNDKES